MSASKSQFIDNNYSKLFSKSIYFYNSKTVSLWSWAIFEISVVPCQVFCNFSIEKIERLSERLNFFLHL